jgi:hypothetical protein
MPKYLFTSQNSSNQHREGEVKNPQLVALPYQENELRKSGKS